MHAHRVLLIEDEPELAELLVELLRDFDYDVRSAESFSAAVEVLSDFRPCAVLSDVTLPDVDRDQLVARLRERVGQAPIVLMSAIAPSELRRLAAEQGAQGAISKPFELSDFEKAVRFECAEAAADQPSA